MKNSLQKLLSFAGTLILALGFTAPFTQAQQSPPIKIGFSMGLTGGLGPAGNAAVLAMEIWRNDVNKKGGLLGRNVEFIYCDDASQSSTVPSLAHGRPSAPFRPAVQWPRRWPVSAILHPGKGQDPHIERYSWSRQA
jgi:Periplasmic binding protein